jgi:hypothetical protein
MQGEAFSSRLTAQHIIALFNNAYNAPKALVAPLLQVADRAALRLDIILATAHRVYTRYAMCGSRPLKSALLTGLCLLVSMVKWPMRRPTP